MTGEGPTSHEQRPTSGTGSPYPRAPSRAKTIPAGSLDNGTSEESGRPQRRNSLSQEGIDRSRNTEYDEPQRRVEELESEVETLQLQVQEGHRGRERLIVELDTLRIDSLQREADAVIREVERRAGQDAKDSPSVVTSSTTSNSSSTASTTQLTPPANNPGNPEVEEEQIHPVVPPSPSRQQRNPARQQHPSSWSPSLHGGYARYRASVPGSVYNHHTPPVSPVNNLQQVSWIQRPSRGEESYANSRAFLPHHSESAEPSITHLRQAPKYDGRVLYGYMEPIGQSQHRPLGRTIDVRNSGQFLYPQGNAVSDPQQGFPPILLTRPYPYTEGNPSRSYRCQPPRFSHLGTLGYTGESAYSLPQTSMHGSESHHSRGSSWPRVQQPSPEDPEDNYFVGGFNPCLYQPRETRTDGDTPGPNWCLAPEWADGNWNQR